MAKKKRNIFTTYKRRFIWVCKKITLPGFEGQSIYDVFTFLIQEINRDAVTTRASAVTFSFLLSLFPAIIVLFTLIPYLPVEGLQLTLMGYIRDLMPHNAYLTIDSTIQDIVSRQRGGLLSLGIVLALYYSTRGVFDLMNSFDKAYPNFRQRSFITKIGVSIKITLLLFLLLLLSVIFIIAGEYVINMVMNYLNFRGALSYYILNSIKWVAIILLFYASVSLIYYYGPAVQKRWRFFSAGSTLAAFLSILTSLLFSFFINQFGQYNKIYGSIGTLIVIMLWLYYNSLILLMGFELNASIDINRHNKQLQKS